eukprot:910003-Pelagomonas_calceolata.AAC.2
MIILESAPLALPPAIKPPPAPPQQVKLRFAGLQEEAISQNSCATASGGSGLHVDKKKPSVKAHDC